MIKTANEKKIKSEDEEIEIEEIKISDEEKIEDVKFEDKEINTFNNLNKVLKDINMTLYKNGYYSKPEKLYENLNTISDIFMDVNINIIEKLKELKK